MVVEVPLRLEDPETRGQKRGNHFLGSCLTHAACNTDQPSAPGAPNMARKGLQCFCSLCHGDEVRANRRRGPLPKFLFHHRTCRPSFENLKDKFVAVMARAADGEKKLAWLKPSRINRAARHGAIRNRLN